MFLGKNKKAYWPKFGTILCVCLSHPHTHLWKKNTRILATAAAKFALFY